MTPEQARELDSNPIWQAFKRGETIEHFGIADGIWRNEPLICPDILLLHRDCYRIKQERFPEPPDGEQWHNPEGLTPSQVGVKDGWRLCLVGEILPKGYEWWGLHKWNPYKDSVKGAGQKVGLFEAYTSIRTREPLPQKPRMVPLGPEDVPPGSVVRKTNQSIGMPWLSVLAVDSRSAWIPGHVSTISTVSFASLQQEWQINRPGEDWQKCEKPEETK